MLRLTSDVCSSALSVLRNLDYRNVPPHLVHTIIFTAAHLRHRNEDSVSQHIVFLSSLISTAVLQESELEHFCLLSSEFPEVRLLMSTQATD